MANRHTPPLFLPVQLQRPADALGGRGASLGYLDVVTSPLAQIDDNEECTAGSFHGAIGAITETWLCQRVSTVLSFGILCLGILVLIAAKLALHRHFE